MFPYQFYRKIYFHGKFITEFCYFFFTFTYVPLDEYLRSTNFRELYFTGINFRELKKFNFLRVLIFANWSYFEFSRELIWRLPTFNKM